MDILKKDMFKKAAITVATLVIFPAAFSAENVCKKLSKEQCDVKTQSCTWVESYERKDGKTVAAYCRKKPESKKTSDEKSEE